MIAFGLFPAFLAENSNGLLRRNGSGVLVRVFSLDFIAAGTMTLLLSSGNNRPREQACALLHECELSGEALWAVLDFPLAEATEEFFQFLP